VSSAVELWQLYDNQGCPLVGKGAVNEDVYGKALLHAASHVWIWRQTSNGLEILLQKRAKDKGTWPGRYDISAAGHIDLGEDPLTAAIRETQEEIGHTVDKSDLKFIGAHRCYTVAPDNAWTENELSFLYLLELKTDATFALTDGEVDSLEWKLMSDIQQEVVDETTQDGYVPHGEVYFGMVFEAIERTLKTAA
jgi:isopentenyldiphosphate isomerase